MNRISDYAVSNHSDQPHILVIPADDQQLIKEEAPDDRRPAVDPEVLHVKEEQEELWISLQEEQLNVKEETDDAQCSVSAVPLKNEDDEKKPLFSQPHQHQVRDGAPPSSSSADRMTSSADGIDHGGAETIRIPDLKTQEDDSNSSETEVSEDDEDGKDSDSGSKTENSDWKKNKATDSGVNTVNKYFSCSECGREFVNHQFLQRYTTRPLRIICSNCLVNNKCFRVEKNVGSHTKAQTQQKSFSCDDCGKMFTRKDYLNTHTRIHTGQKPFSCGICGQTFSDKSNFRSHMRIHSGQKLSVCNACGQRFSRKTHLNTHMRIHTGQKPFVCDMCGRRFSDKSNLRSHRKIHT